MKTINHHSITPRRGKRGAPKRHCNPRSSGLAKPRLPRPDAGDDGRPPKGPPHGNSRAFLNRGPSLAVTLVTGLVAAKLSACFELTLREMVGLAFFLTVLLGLPEAVAAQSAMATQAAGPDGKGKQAWSAYLEELRAALLLAVVASVMVGGFAMALRGNAVESLCVGLGLLGAISAAGLYGVLVPRLLSALRRGVEWHGPVVLAVTDLTTLTILFGLATWLAG